MKSFRRYRLSIRMRAGISLTELVVVVGILTLLFAISAPAIQSAREASRRIQCESNLRQLVVAALNLETVARHLPGSFMNAHPESVDYRSDRGLFITLLPYADGLELYSRFDLAVPTNSQNNKSLLRAVPSYLQCPSASEREVLHDMSGHFSGPIVPELNGIACDYMGNGGCLDNGTIEFGVIRARVGKLTRERRFSEITDGSSHTLLFWESVGGYLRRFGSGTKASIDRDCQSTIEFSLDSSDRNLLRSRTQASSKSYMFSWSGFRTGMMQAYKGRVANVSNEYGGLFSSHVAIVPCCLSDGCIRLLSDSIDANVAIALATAGKGETDTWMGTSNN